MMTWVHVLGGAMILWLPITAMILVAKENMELAEGARAFVVIFSAIVGLSIYLICAWWLIMA
jgi:hypothetical protein